MIKIDFEGLEIQLLEDFIKSFITTKIKVCQIELGHAHIERRENFKNFYNFFQQYDYFLEALKLNGKINLIDKYDEIYENYYCTKLFSFLERYIKLISKIRIFLIIIL